MPSSHVQAPATVKGEPRLPAWIALVGVGGLFYALPSALKVGPDWAVLVLPALLAAPGALLPRQRHRLFVHVLSHAAVALMTAAMAGSIGMLISRLPRHADSPAELLRAAAVLWAGNILIFAGWYWRLDAGGPHCRDLRESHTDGAFLFPQMTLTKELRAERDEQQWTPHFIDYLFMAFTISTASSPTDVPVLSRWAKALMMLQALISLTTIALLAARAVNIL